MNIIIGIILIYTLLVLTSSGAMYYIWNNVYVKICNNESKITWKDTLIVFSIVYLCFTLVIIIIFAILDTFF